MSCRYFKLEASLAVTCFTLDLWSQRSKFSKKEIQTIYLRILTLHIATILSLHFVWLVRCGKTSASNWINFFNLSRGYFCIIIILIALSSLSLLYVRIFNDRRLLKWKQTLALAHCMCPLDRQRWKSFFFSPPETRKLTWRQRMREKIV